MTQPRTRSSPHRGTAHPPPSTAAIPQRGAARPRASTTADPHCPPTVDLIPGALGPRGSEPREGQW